MKTELEIEQAINTYSDTVRRICFLYALQRCDVEDTFQNVFLKYARSDQTFTDMEHGKAWFITVTMNVCKDFFKSWFRRKVDMSDDLTQFSIDDRSRSQEILEQVMMLPKRYRIVIYLYYYEGYKLSEIAQICGRNENTINTWMKRGRAMLKDQLGGDDFE